MGPENIDRYSASWNNMDWTVSNQLLNAMAWNTNSIQLSNWITLNPREFSEYYKIARNSIIEKYWFSEADILEFHKGLQWIHLTEVPWHPNWRWCSEHKILNWESNANFTWTIYINPRMINNSDLFFSVLYHELDHYAFYFKKFNDSKIPNIHAGETRQTAINEFVQNNESQSCRFSTELLARIDTADNLMARWISWDRVREYGPWDENLTTWESHYRESIIYAQKFLKFQIWLYNLLAKSYWINYTKQRNMQLSDKANKNFNTIMNWLRDSIFNSQSIETSKNTIDRCITIIQNSRSRNQFCNLRNQ